MATIPTTIPFEDITDIEFLTISDHIRPGQWVEWEVRFDYQGDPCLGFLDGCPHHPTLHHGDQIENAELFY